MPIAGRGRRVGAWCRTFRGIQESCRLDLRLTHVTFAASQLAGGGASNATSNALIGVRGIVSHTSLFISCRFVRPILVNLS